MRVFQWVSAEQLPSRMDLRLRGWSLVDCHEMEDCVALVQATGIDDAGWSQLLSTGAEARRRTLVSGVNTGYYRASLLQRGFGDAVDDSTTLDELTARAERLAGAGAWLPRRRMVDELELDLMAREARLHGKALALMPREFELLWRLAATPNAAVSKQTLVEDVWKVGYTPESNSIAVHMSRLRGKLAAMGLPKLIETSGGGYRLRHAAAHAADSFRTLQ